MAHTILLIQSNAKPESRTYTDYDSVNECMEGVCKIYEEHLKTTNPNLPSITYDISQLFEFIDQVMYCCRVSGTVPDCHSVSSWQISPVWSTRSPPTPTLRTTRIGLKRRSTSSSDGRLARPANSSFLELCVNICVFRFHGYGKNSPDLHLHYLRDLMSIKPFLK